jgi:hypothetical protein
MTLATIGTMAMREDPWTGLEAPSAAQTISARRVDESGPFDFFWGRDIDGHVLLGLEHPGDPIAARRLPHPRGLDLSDGAVAPGRSLLCIRLVAAEQRDIFRALCEDIVEAAAAAGGEQEALAIALSRTWRWHHLLRGGSSGLLSPEEQKGLIGELSFLRDHVLGVVPARDAVRGWRGPLGAPKDFEIGSVCVEVKARRGASAPYISISSEDQLDDTGLSALFLLVVDLHSSVEGESGQTLTVHASQARDAVESADLAAVAEFEGLLAAAGFRWSDDYSDTRWTVDESQLYRVDDGFPRIVRAGLEDGVARVRYQAQLAHCASFVCPMDALAVAIDEMGRN